MTKRGDHTWNLHVAYHSCPECGHIIESRNDYYYQLGEYLKDLKCERCHHSFTEKKVHTPTLGPLIGNPQPTEIYWKDD